MDFGTAGDEFLGFTCQGGLLNGLRWSDWAPTGRTDYDVYIFEEPNDATLISQSEGDQLSQPPLETSLGCTDTDDADFLKVWRFANDVGSATGDVLEFMTNNDIVEHASNPYSATGPAADSNNPGAVSVGAVDPWDGVQIAAYSSQGPTNDERVKPDLSATSNFSASLALVVGSTAPARPRRSWRVRPLCCSGRTRPSRPLS